MFSLSTWERIKGVVDRGEVARLIALAVALSIPSHFVNFIQGYPFL